MASVRLTCPHCARIDRLSISKPLATTDAGYRRAWLRRVDPGEYDMDVVAGLNCHLCGGWSIGVFSASIRNLGVDILNGGPEAATPIEGSERVELLAAYPPPPVFMVAAAVPELAKVFFIEAQEDLRAGRSAAGVIGKCRSVLDLCLKELGATGAGRKARIADLRSKGQLTEALASWSSRLWDDGNDAIHDLVGDQAAAQQHVTFLELFFEVAFGLPAQVAAAQATATEVVT